MKNKLSITSWALYDLANQFFALNIISHYFPRWLSIERALPEVLYSVSFAISMFLVAIIAPILGTIADIEKNHKRFLIYLTILSVIFTFLLGVFDNIVLILIIFIIANFGCQSAVVFYNALLGKIAPRNRLGFVSGLGRMFSYIGAILALYLVKPFVSKAGYQATFIPTALLFLFFSLPAMIFIKEKPVEKSASISIKKIPEIFKRLRLTLKECCNNQGMRNFLIATFFALCAVNAIILFMSVYAAKVFGITQEADIIKLISVSTIFAILGSFVSGFLSDILGYRKSMIAVFVLWLLSFILAGLLKPPFHWLVGSLAGFSLGAIWVVSRALVIKLIPEEKLGEVFGIFNFVVYFSAIIGPVWWGCILLLTSKMDEASYRLAVLSLVFFMVIALRYISKVPKEIKW